MKIMKIGLVTKTVLIAAFVALAFALAFASGDAANGRKLFNDPSFAGSTNSKSCNSCHKDGRNLEDAGTKTYSSLMGMRVQSLEEVVNICIEQPLKGKALPVDSKQMQDIVAYIKTLGK